jgi:hypothetical protein
VLGAIASAATALFMVVAIGACERTDIGASEAQRLGDRHLTEIGWVDALRAEHVSFTSVVKQSDRPDPECLAASMSKDYMEYLDENDPQYSAYLRDLSRKLDGRPHYSVDYSFPPESPSASGSPFPYLCLFYDHTTGEYLGGVKP